MSLLKNTTLLRFSFGSGREVKGTSPKHFTAKACDRDQLIAPQRKGTRDTLRWMRSHSSCDHCKGCGGYFCGLFKVTLFIGRFRVVTWSRNFNSKPHKDFAKYESLCHCSRTGPTQHRPGRLCSLRHASEVKGSLAYSFALLLCVHHV